MYPTRRFVDADNSCLFSSIGYLLDKNEFDTNTKYRYRQLLVQFLENYPNIEDILDCPKDEYINKIINPNCWGGAIELKLFSEMFQVEIASIDTQSNRIDIFGQENNYTNRIFIIYNGIHYDPLVMATTKNQKDDITIFDVDDDNITISFQEFCKTFKKNGDFVDLSTINTLKCLECEMVFENQDDATEHGINYNHWSFSSLS
ncbi:putative ubiquitin thioesterase OTU1-like protein [Chlorella virus XW01]|nr:putative ubiquitin thioesterase OTU1-like protein [Chlorella virus XW01]